MQPISIEVFASMVMKNNKGYRKKELVKTLSDTLAAKKNGAKCMTCGAPIWAAGSAIIGSNLCFTCTTDEANDSDDYEMERQGVVGNRRRNYGGFLYSAYTF